MYKVVEVVDNSASLFSSSFQNHPICLLVKFLVNKTSFNFSQIYILQILHLFSLKNDKSVSIDGKSTNSSLVESFLEELKSHLNQ